MFIVGSFRVSLVIDVGVPDVARSLWYFYGPGNPESKALHEKVWVGAYHKTPLSNMQEAYHPPCSKSSRRGVPILDGGGTYLGVAPPILTWPGVTFLGQGVPSLAMGYLPWPGGTYLMVPPSLPG